MEHNSSWLNIFGMEIQTQPRCQYNCLSLLCHGWVNSINDDGELKAWNDTRWKYRKEGIIQKKNKRKSRKEKVLDLRQKKVKKMACQEISGNFKVLLPSFLWRSPWFSFLLVYVQLHCFMSFKPACCSVFRKNAPDAKIHPALSFWCWIHHGEFEGI